MPTYITTVRIEVPDDNLGGFNATHQINGYLKDYLDDLHAAEFDFEIVCSRDETPVRGRVGRPRNKVGNGTQEALTGDGMATATPLRSAAE